MFRFILLALVVGCSTAISNPKNEQQLLSNAVDEKHYGLPLSASSIFFPSDVIYTTTIGIGTPPRLIRAAVDLNWAGTYVESVFCTNKEACSPYFRMRYNHTESSSYLPNGTAVSTTWKWLPEVEGFLSYDTLSLDQHLQIPNHVFIETTRSWTNFGGEYDSILGLSPSSRSLYAGNGDEFANVSLPSVFEDYMAENRHHQDRTKNMFSLLAPYPNMYQGDLSFGTHHADLADGELVPHKLYPSNARSWSIKAPSIKMRHRNGSMIFDKPMPGYVAHIDSTISGIGIPKDLGIIEKIHEATGARPAPGCSPLTTVECDKVASMPDLILDFDGQEIVLRGEDYFDQTGALFCFRPPYCQVMTLGNSIVDTDGENAIILGTDFLKMVYAVFDWDNRTISLAKANRKVLLM